MEKRQTKLRLEEHLEKFWEFGNYKFNGLRQFNQISERSTSHMNSCLWYDKEKNQFLLLKDFKTGKCHKHIDYFNHNVINVDSFIFLMSTEKDLIHLATCDGIRDVVHLYYDAIDNQYMVTGYKKDNLKDFAYCYRYENLKNKCDFEMWWK
jgi:hypothetical protein